MIKIINIILIVLLFIVGIDTIIKIKKSENKLIEDIRSSIIIRIDIIMVLIVLIAILNIINIITNL